MWKTLCWESRTVRGAASPGGSFFVLRSAGDGEFGQVGQAEICLVGYGGLKWVRPGEAFMFPKVSSRGTVAIPRRTETGFAIDFVDSTGRDTGGASWAKRVRPAVSSGDWETIVFTPDETACLVSAFGVADSAQTSLFEVDFEGRVRWEADLGEVGLPTIEFSSDGRYVFAHDLDDGRRFSGRFVVLTHGGTIAREYDMIDAARPEPESIVFSDRHGLYQLDLRKPEPATRIEPQDLYPLLLRKEFDVHQPALRMLFRTARRLFDEDAGLIQTIEAMRSDPVFAPSLEQLDIWLRFDKRASNGTPER
jgi:hypothetical protein